MRKAKSKYKYSPWSGQAYKSAPNRNELVNESMDVLRRHPTIGKAIRLEAMDKFIADYRKGLSVKGDSAPRRELITD